MRRGTIASGLVAANGDVQILQRDQPEGVPPLPLTGERTLPDVPEENYWFRRHLAVYRWIASRCAGPPSLDMACGEGYGSAGIAERAGEGWVADVTAACPAGGVGVDANPDAGEPARRRYRATNPLSPRALAEAF